MQETVLIVFIALRPVRSKFIFLWKLYRSSTITVLLATSLEDVLTANIKNLTSSYISKNCVCQMNYNNTHFTCVNFEDRGIDWNIPRPLLDPSPTPTSFNVCVLYLSVHCSDFFPPLQFNLTPPGHTPSASFPPKWFFGKIPRHHAEQILKDNQRFGDLLVRASESTRGPGEFSLSVRQSSRDGHAVIRHYKLIRMLTSSGLNGYKLDIDEHVSGQFDLSAVVHSRKNYNRVWYSLLSFIQNQV